MRQLAQRVVTGSARGAQAERAAEGRVWSDGIRRAGGAQWAGKEKQTKDEKEKQNLPLQPFPLEEPVVVHAVEVVSEGRHAQVAVDQSGF